MHRCVSSSVASRRIGVAVAKTRSTFSRPTSVFLQFSQHRNASSFGRSASQQVIPVSAARLEQLLEAEITTLSLRVSKPLTVKNLLNLTENAKMSELASLLHEELPVRFAQRIKMLEALPDWRKMESIARVRQMYVTSFKELRMADPSQPGQFQGRIRKIKERHAQTNLLVGGFKQYAEVRDLQVAEINEWLDAFFALRLSTNMLMSHFLQMSKESLESIGSIGGADMFQFDDAHNPYRSSIDPQCHVPRIASHAAEVVKQMSRLRYGVAPPIEVVDNNSQAISWVPRYLLYIISELLKNSVRATVELHGAESGKELPPIRVLVSGGESDCCIRISDEGGGIPRQDIQKVWSYLYTTADPIESTSSRKAVDAPADLGRLFGSLSAEASPATQQSQGDGVAAILGSPLAGLGCGLPLSRLYARHLGGAVELQTTPKYGTDVYVYIDSLGNSDNLPNL